MNALIDGCIGYHETAEGYSAPGWENSLQSNSRKNIICRKVVWMAFLYLRTEHSGRHLVTLFWSILQTDCSPNYMTELVNY